MFYCFRRLISPIAAMVAILAMGMATPARANLQIWLSETGPLTSANSVANDTGTPGAASYINSNFAGNLNINTSAGSTSPGTPGFAQTTSSTTTLINNTGSAITVFLSIGSTGFTAPVPPLTVTTSVSATVVNGSASNLLSYNSYVNSSNGQNATTGTTTASPQTLNITAVASGLENATSFAYTTSGTPYSMTELYQITLGGNSSITLSGSTSVVPVPEPSTMAIAGLGALGMIGYGLRRRKALGA